MNNILIKAKTWTRDSHSLFDYESRSVFPKQLQSFSPCHIVRYESNVQLLEDVSPHDDNLETLARIHQHGNHLALSNDNSAIWYIVKHMKSPPILSEGDILKLGRIRLRIKALRGLEDTDSESQTQESSEEDGDTEMPLTHKDVCRVCFSCENEHENPMIAPCSCSGSVKYIHLDCLQRWIDSRKVVKESENSINVYWKSMDCEICKVPYPSKISTKGRTFQLYSLDTPATPYIVFETMVGDRANDLHVVSFINKGVVKVGRGHDNDIRISDISVSRFHATIHYRDNGFVIEDNNSKFGSLIMAKEPVVLQAPVHVQIGRTVLQMEPQSQ